MTSTEEPATESVGGFAPGDTVYLKSGSPRMTILRLTGEHANVMWCAYGSNGIQEKNIPLIALKRANSR